MKINFQFFLVIVVFIMSGCGAPKLLTSVKDDAEKAFAAGNSGEALTLWKRYFEQQAAAKKEITPEEYARAGKVAYSADQPDQALGWFDQARYGNYSDQEMYLDLAAIYKGRNNLSRELTALEFLDSGYPGSKNSDSIRSRLFKIYIEAEDTVKATNIWNKLSPVTRKKESFLNDYFLINSRKGNNTLCDSLAGLLLQVNPKHVPALEWNAKKYYWLGETRYQQEMEKYNRNKTVKQYNILLKELEKSTADFKKALYWLEILWKIDPGEKYALYFANIYIRFRNEEKSNYYKSFIKK